MELESHISKSLKEHRSSINAKARSDHWDIWEAPRFMKENLPKQEQGATAGKCTKSYYSRNAQLRCNQARTYGRHDMTVSAHQSTRETIARSSYSGDTIQQHGNVIKIPEGKKRHLDDLQLDRDNDSARADFGRRRKTRTCIGRGRRNTQKSTGLGRVVQGPNE